MITTGILVLPPFNEKAIPIIEQSVTHSHVISNYSLNIPYQKIVFTSDVSTNKDLICIDPQNVNLNLKQPASLYAAFLIEMVKRSQRLLIVSSGPRLPLIYAILASQKCNMSNIRMFVGEKIFFPDDIMAELQKANQTKLKQQWNLITNSTALVVGNQIQNKLPDKKSLLKTPNGATLRPYQQQMVDFALSHPRAGLFVDMGLGKTLATLATLVELVKQHRLDSTRPILVVAPITVALDTWSREAEKWGYDIDIKINIQLSVKKRTELLDDISQPQKKLTLVTTNPAQLASIIKYYQQKRLTPPFEATIVDELSQFKSFAAQRFHNLITLTQHIPYFYGLTGTPAPNNLLDIWTEMIAIDNRNRQSFGYNFYQYRQKFFMPDKIGKDGTIYSYRLKPEHDLRIYDLMKPSAFSMKSEGLIDLPEIIYDNRYVKLPHKAQVLYDKMDQELRQKLNELQNENSHDKKKTSAVSLDLGNNSIDIANNAVLTGKLAQLSSGAIYDGVLNVDEENSGIKSNHYKVFQDVKFQALKDIVDNSISPILVFFYFKSELERMSKYIDFEYLDPHNPEFQNIISRWNNGEIHVLAAHPASAGHGLNLQDGGHTIVWLTTTWSNEQYRQAVKRIYRSGQTHTVSVIHILAENTVDEDIIKRLDTKEEGQDALMSALDIADRPIKR